MQETGMPTSDNDSRTPKTPRRKTSATGESAAPKRASKKKTVVTFASPLATDTKIAERAPASSPTMIPSPTTKAPTVAPATVARPMPLLTGTRPDPAIARVVDADERRRMIAEAAHHKFLQPPPGTGSPARDWYEAETEIDALLAEQGLSRTQ